MLALLHTALLLGANQNMILFKFHSELNRPASSVRYYLCLCHSVLWLQLVNLPDRRFVSGSLAGRARTGVTNVKIPWATLEISARTELFNCINFNGVFPSM